MCILFIGFLYNDTSFYASYKLRYFDDPVYQYFKIKLLIIET